jgi:DNA-directed RNA polymerase subunit M/transcription elongation factor TFIIS
MTTVEPTQKEIVMRFCQNCKEVTQTYQIIIDEAGLQLYSCTKCGSVDSVVEQKRR